MKYKYENPVSMPRGSHYGSDYWIVPSYKLHRNVHLYSMLEYAAFLELEMDAEVLHFCEQPLQVELLVSGKMRKTVFDFYIVYHDQKEAFQEVKYQSDINSTEEKCQRAKEQIKRQETWCSLNEFDYKVVTDETLYKYPFRNQNLSILATNVFRHDESLNCDLYLKYLIEQIDNNCTIEQIISAGILPPMTEWDILSYLYYKKKIDININNRPLDNKSEVIVYGN